MLHCIERGHTNCLGASPSTRADEGPTLPMETATHTPEDVPVVIVEDDPDAREALKALVELDGYRVHTAASAEQTMTAMTLAVKKIFRLPTQSIAGSRARWIAGNDVASIGSRSNFRISV